MKDKDRRPDSFIVYPNVGDTMYHAQSSSTSVYASAEIFLCSAYKPRFLLDFF